MRLTKLVTAVVLAGTTTGCGLALGAAIALSPQYWFGDPLSQSLVATNDAASGDHVLVAVQFKDVATHAVVHQEAVSLASGQALTAGVPPGSYEVVGLYDDGYADPVGPQPGYVVTIDPTAEAAVVFTHP